MITPKQKKFNDFVLREAGLELDNENHVIDQDTGLPIIVKNKVVKYNNTNISRLTPGEIEFDPLNNALLANTICGNYISKLEESDINVVTFGISNKEKNTIGQAKCIANGGATISSESYILDSLKYIGLIAAINDTNVNSKETIKLTSYDLKKPRTRRR